MRQRSPKLGLLAGASLFAVLGTSVPMVMARDGTDDTSTSTTQTKTETEQSQSGSRLPSATAETEQDRLAQTKQKSCLAHEAAANHILQNRARLGALQMQVIGKIATNVENFYQKSGKTLADYDSLVANVNSAQSTAQTAVDTVKNDKLTLKCDGTDPKGVGELFKTDVKKERQAIKAYKLAVKNLIVGVHSVNKSTANENEGSSQ